MKVDIKKTMVSIGSVLGFLALFGISGGFITGNLQGIWKSPERIEVLEERVAKLEEANLHLEHFKESMFSFAEAITDKDDVRKWMMGTHGKEYPSSVRNTNEGYEMAFVKYLWMIYELRYDTDSTRYIMLHDKNEHGSNRSDLYIGD